MILYSSRIPFGSENGRQQKMFQKKQIIYSETQGVCQVENIVQLSTKNNRDNSISYYVLRSIFDRDQTAYIPVENHQVELREIFTIEEAEHILADPKTKENEKLKAAAEYVLRIGGKTDGTTTVNS